MVVVVVVCVCVVVVVAVPKLAKRSFSINITHVVLVTFTCHYTRQRLHNARFLQGCKRMELTN